MTPTTNGRRAKGRITLVVLALLSVMVMAASVLLAVLLNDRQVPGATTETTPPVILGGFSCESAEAAKLFPFKGGVIKVDTARISSLDLTGNEKWGADCALLSPACFSNGSVMLVADLSGSSFFVLDEKGIRRTGTVTGTITGASVGTGSLFALIIDQPGNKGLVRVMSTDGDKEFEWDFISRKSGFVLSAAFAPDNAWLDIATLDTDRHSTQSMLKRLNTATGAQLAQFIPDGTGVYAVIAHDDEMNTVMVSSEAAVGFHTDAAVAYSNSFFRIHRATTTGRGVLIIAQKTPDGEIAAFLLSSDGTMKTGPNLPGIPSSVCVAGDLAAIAAGSQAYLLDLESFTLKETLSAGSEILRLDLDTAAGIVAVMQDGVGRLATR